VLGHQPHSLAFATQDPRGA